MPGYEDYPKAELKATAEQAIADYAAQGIPAVVYFKASCPQCGERCAFSEPNTMYDEMECFACEHTFPFTVGNYVLLLGATGG